MSEQDKEQAGVLLTEDDIILALGEENFHRRELLPSYEYDFVIARAQLAKAREAVKGAELTPQQVQDSYHSTPELLEKAKEYYGDTIEYFDARLLACRLSVAEAQTQAILRALGGE